METTLDQAAAEAGPAAPEGLPHSPSFSIAAVKVASRRPTFDVQAWPGRRSSNAGSRWEAGSGSGSSDGGSSDGGGSVGAPGALEPQPLPAWRRAWQRLAGAAAALVRAVPLPTSHSTSKLLAPRTQSTEVLSLGREQSAPCAVARKRSMQPRSSEAAVVQAVALSGRSLALQRWRRACRAVADAREVLRCMDLLANRLAPPEDRLHAAFLLRMRVGAYPRPERLASGLLARHGGGRLKFMDHIMNELYITGERIFTFFVPPPMGHHFPHVTLLLVTVLIIVYFFMAGQYGQYQAISSPASAACMGALHRSGAAPAWGPGSMVRWIAPRNETWCFPGAPGKFDAPFLIDWGARWTPDMRRSPHRWLTSTLLHQSFMHLLSNCLLLAGLAGQMEIKHGSWRIAVLAVLSGLGGNLFSAVTEATCVAVVGASGIVFGAGAAVIADTMHNFETLSRPILRAVIMLSFLAYFGASVGTTPTGTSHMSHVGGFVSALAAALVLLRNPHRGYAEWACTAVGAVGCLAIFVALPCIFYLRLLPQASC